MNGTQSIYLNIILAFIFVPLRTSFSFLFNLTLQIKFPDSTLYTIIFISFRLPVHPLTTLIWTSRITAMIAIVLTRQISPPQSPDRLDHGSQASSGLVSDIACVPFQSLALSVNFWDHRFWAWG